MHWWRHRSGLRHNAWASLGRGAWPYRHPPSGTPARGRMSCDCSSSHTFCFLLFIAVRVDPILQPGLLWSSLDKYMCAYSLFMFPTFVFIERKPRYGCSCIIMQRKSEKRNFIYRAATAVKAPKAWALFRFWVSKRSYKRQLVKKKLG